ncbi:MAG: hypothetical protein IC227_00770 [Enterococcus lacertideformus]|uniref:Uncharacterized protein n=1 Tax=Enterococcus lacertideformus TaxID=2771493 RepID=A0A931AUB3_9ENTE|nr:hypothetical protein [Enterococcus lacertideformus]
MPTEQEQRELENSNMIRAWKAMLETHGLNETVAFLSAFYDESENVFQIITSFYLPEPLKQEALSSAKNPVKVETSPDFKSIQELLDITNAWNAMLNIHGSNTTLAFLSACNYKNQSIKFLTAALSLPTSMDRVAEAEKIIKTKKATDFNSSQDLVITLQSLNTMIEVYGANKTLFFLSTCNYTDQSIKFLTASLHLPETMNRATEADRIIKMDKARLVSNFQSDQELVIVIKKWMEELKTHGFNKTLTALFKSSYTAERVKFILANLLLPEKMSQSVKTQKIFDSNKENNLNINNLAKKCLDKQTLNSFIDSFELPKDDVKLLKKEAILKTQKEIEYEIRNHLNELKPPLLRLTRLLRNK